MLQVEGYNVTTCGRGDEALEMVRRAHVRHCDGGSLHDAGARPRDPQVGADDSARHDRARDDGQPERRVEHGSAALRRVGLSAQAVLGDAPAGAAWPRRARRARERERDTAQAEARKRHGNSDKLTLLGASAAFRRVVELARKVASTNASVMLVGESGTGKEMIAQFVHRHSNRASQPLVPLNCAAIPEHLLESEMFGHRKGAFTGADRDKVGLLEMANGGTFFLDELTEMPLPLQAKLLRVVQDGVLRRVGSEQQDAVVDVRFISATNRDPGEAIRSKNLREDLYFRLNVFPITLPPLRDRVEDIPMLATLLPRAFLGASPRAEGSATALRRRRLRLPDVAPLARQRPRTAECHRARRRPGAARLRDPSGRDSGAPGLDVSRRKR